MTHQLGTRILWIFTFLLLPTIVSGQPISEEMSLEIVKRIFHQARINNEKQPVFKYTESVDTKIFNSKSDELETTTRVVLKRTTSPDGLNESVTISYIKNGEELSPSDYDPGGDATFYEVLGPEGEEHYFLVVVESLILDNTEVYRVLVTPKEEDDEHFKGSIYFDKVSLLPVQAHGTLADTPFGVRSIEFKLSYTAIDGFQVPSESKIITYVHVPFVFANKKLVINGVNRDHEVRFK